MNYDEALLNKSREKIELDNEMIIFLNKEYFKFKGLTNDEILKRLDLIKEDKLTNAGYLCFAKKIRYIPAASIKAARFKGNSMATFIDMKNFDSNLISAVDDILEFVSRHINMKVIFNGDSRRKELWDFPIAALREAVINAVVHRDYSDPGNIQVRIFDDIIEVWSPGRLPKEIDISRLLVENRSIPRNKNLARIFYQVNLIENWGTGFHRMAEACRKNENPPPLFEEKTGAFVITFKKRNETEG